MRDRKARRFYSGRAVLLAAWIVAPFSQAADSRTEDGKAVRAAMEAFVKAFDARDAKALAAVWTQLGEYQSDNGAVVQGRETLEKAFGEFFARTPEVKAHVSPESLRFLSNDVALEEGTVRIQRGVTAPITAARYHALFAREDGAWRLAQLHEMQDDSQPPIEDLAWLIGEWKTTDAGGAEIHTKYSWDAHKRFIHVQFTIKEKELSLSGSQVIGVDPATGALHTWTFEADGGIGEAEWSRDGDHWALDVAGTLADGRSLVETNILRRLDADTFTWQSVHRWLDEAEIPDLAPVKVTRIKPGQ